MYRNFYGFHESPFNLTPDPRFVFLSRNHKEAFAHLLYGINNRTGFIALTGEVGAGKTTVLRTLLGHLDADYHRTALIFNPCLSASGLLQTINQEFGIPASPSPNASSLDSLNRFLLEQKSEGRTVVLVIDEAQNLEFPVLEQIRLISNLETDRDKLIQIVLSGQPEFVKILEKQEMRQLSQRITVQYHLRPMDFNDAVQYIHHRIAVAGGRGKVTFSQGALKRIYGYSRGLPRLINAACDRALLAGYTRETTKITSEIAALGIKDLARNGTLHPSKRVMIWAPIFAALIAFLAAGVYLKPPDLKPFHFWERLWAKEEIVQETGKAEAEEEEIEAEEVKEEKGPVPAAGGELSAAMAAELGKVSESESAQKAFNAVAGFWKAPPVHETRQLEQIRVMQNEARERGLRLYRFSGNLGTLLRIDCPLILEWVVPGASGRRFVALVSMKNERAFFDPLIAGNGSLSSAELEKHWTGQGFLLWKDHLNIPIRMKPGAVGASVKRLQALLRDAGVYKNSLTGVYDDNTRSAVMQFQSAKGLRQDGPLGAQTLSLLYGSIDHFEVPKLTGRSS